MRRVDMDALAELTRVDDEALQALAEPSDSEPIESDGESLNGSSCSSQEDESSGCRASRTHR